PDGVLLAAHRELLVSHREALRRLLPLRPFLQDQPCPVIAEVELPEWLRWHVWQYPAFWIIGADDSHRIEARLVQVDRSTLHEGRCKIDRLISVAVPSAWARRLNGAWEPAI